MHSEGEAIRALRLEGRGSYLGGETDAGLRPLMTEVFIGLFAGPKKARPYSLLPSGC